MFGFKVVNGKASETWQDSFSSFEVEDNLEPQEMPSARTRVQSLKNKIPLTHLSTAVPPLDNTPP